MDGGQGSELLGYRIRQSTARLPALGTWTMPMSLCAERGTQIRGAGVNWELEGSSSCCRGVGEWLAGRQASCLR